MSAYLNEFLILAGAHLVAVASPGPDFALVLRQSLVSGRRAALFSSLGIGSAILVHVAYAFLGVGVLLRSSELAFAIVKWVGAAYLLWLALRCLMARPAVAAGPDRAEQPVTQASKPSRAGDRGAFVTGFLTNVLNPKATLFFLALFSTGVSAATPSWLVLCYGLWLSAATAAWFCLVSVFLTQPAAAERFRRYAHWIDRATGVALAAFALRLLWA